MTADEFATYDAAYVLGALSPEDRQAFEEHLQECDRCAAAVRELAGLPGLLAQTRGGSPGGAFGPGERERGGAGTPPDPGPVPDLVIVPGSEPVPGSVPGPVLPEPDSRSVPGPDVADSRGPGADVPDVPGVPGFVLGVPGSDVPGRGSVVPGAPGFVPVSDALGSDAPGVPVPGSDATGVPGPGSRSVPDLSAMSLTPGSDSVPEPDLSAVPSMPDLPTVPSVPGSLAPGSQAMPDLLPVLMRKVRRRRRIRDGVTGGVAALAVAAGVALAVSVSLPDVSPPPAAPAVAAPPPPPALAMSALGEYPIQAAARIDPQSWGTEVQMSCSYRGGKGGDYSLVALGRDGTEAELATWKALPENTAKVVVGTPMKSQDIASLEIRSVRTGKPLMRLVYP